MAQSRGVPARRALSARANSKDGHSPKLVLCLLARGSRVNPVSQLLRGYELATAETTAQVLRLARRQAYDLYVIVSPLGWLSSAEACRRIRRFDPHTPLIVYVTDASTATEKREVLAAGAQAYIARADYAQHLPGTAGQLIMLAELRSMEAFSSVAGTLREALIDSLARMRPSTAGAGARDGGLGPLKAEARRLFAQAGGSRANFERLWPGIYRDALSQLERRPN